MPGIRELLGVIIILGALAGAAPVFAQTGGLTGSAKDEKGNVLVDYPILIERQDIKGTYKTKTNKKGEYVYVGFAIGNYKITLHDPSGRPVFYISKHVGLGDPTEVSF